MSDLKIEPEELETVRGILRVHVPGLEVWAFGSRVHGENLKPFSDLDLAIITETPLDAEKLAELREAFSESALPFKVDFLDWSVTNERFKRLIRQDYRIVQKEKGG